MVSAAVPVGSVHGHVRGAARKATSGVPDRPVLRPWQGPWQRAARRGHQCLGASKPPPDLDSPTSARPKKFPSEKSTLAYIMSFSQQLLRPSTDVLRFLRKRGSQKAAGGVSLWSQCPASGAEEFTALPALDFSPQPFPLCCVSRALAHESGAVPCLAAAFRGSAGELGAFPSCAGRGVSWGQRGPAGRGQLGQTRSHPAAPTRDGALTAPGPPGQSALLQCS